MTDSHVHVGWFVDRYHSPDKVSKSLRNIGVDTIAVSSTSTCAEEYELILDEFSWLYEEWKENLFQVLWVTPKMLMDNGLKKLLDSDINWKLIKMHWSAHPEFYNNSTFIDNLLSNERLKALPILLHTGEFPECHASVFTHLIATHTERNFILAHGRPLQETSQLLRQYPNVFVDTAFMPISHIQKLIKLGFTDKIIWGSDIPINLHFIPSESSETYITKNIKELRDLVPENLFIKITSTNFLRLFNVNISEKRLN